MTQESESELEPEPDPELIGDAEPDLGVAVREVRTGGSDVSVGGAFNGAE
jgi:hypothetical protein